MGKKLYVGNLPFSADDSTLKELFSQAGSVETASVIMDRNTGRSKGFGFVEMSSEKEMSESIKKFNGTDLDGRPIVVSEAKPQAPRENRGDRRHDRY